MMSHTKCLLLGLIVGTLLLKGCIIEVNGDTDTLRGQGPLAQQFRDVGELDNVVLAMEGDLLIQQGPEVEFRVQAQQNLLTHITTVVRRGTLYIESEPNLELRPTEPIQFILVTPDLEGISLAGSGDVIVEEWQATSIALSNTGSGDMIVIDMAAEVLDVSMAGSGDIEIAGASDIQRLSIVGSGNYNGRTFLTNTTDVSIAGSGDGFISVAQELIASIAGSGSVYYVGDPVITTSIVGSGEVRPLN